MTLNWAKMAPVLASAGHLGPLSRTVKDWAGVRFDPIQHLNPNAFVADKCFTMHGILPPPQWLIAARVKKAIIVAACVILAVSATVGLYDFANSTAQGHKLLIRLGFEYPPDCG
jgi:hypothetical protein